MTNHRRKLKPSQTLKTEDAPSSVPMASAEQPSPEALRRAMRRLSAVRIGLLFLALSLAVVFPPWAVDIMTDLRDSPDLADRLLLALPMDDVVIGDIDLATVTDKTGLDFEGKATLMLRKPYALVSATYWGFIAEPSQEIYGKTVVFRHLHWRRIMVEWLLILLGATWSFFRLPVKAAQFAVKHYGIGC